ncbi:MAG TPA: methyltransferase, partial [Thermomicrobiaceae bacterium]|nr:methyltransferase [Thermomicrobiaceae bacterium]
LLAALNGTERVDLVDVNLLAVASARENARKHRLNQVDVMPSDLFSAVAGRSYDLIVSNPPFHQGKAVDYSVTDRMIRQAADHLTPDGRLILVANAFIRYEPALRERFAQVRKLAETSRYQLFAAGKPLATGAGAKTHFRRSRGSG